MFATLILLEISVFPAYGLTGVGVAFVGGGMLGILGYWHVTRIA